MAVVSNSSPLIALARIRRLDLLPAIFESVLIPPAVAREIAPSIPALPTWLPGDHLADAKAKLRALADADLYGDRFLRIESVAKAADGTLRSLDLQDTGVRKAIRDFEGGKVSALYEAEHATPYK